MACGCKKRMAEMQASKSKVVRTAAKVIEPAHNAVMRVADTWDARRLRKRAGKKAQARVIGQPIPPSEN